MDKQGPVSLTLHGVALTTRYHDVFREIDLHVPPGSLCVLLGSRQAGKSALLRSIAGLDRVSSGTISVDDRDITRVPPRGREIAHMAQSYPLWPDLSVVDNVRFVLKDRGLKRRDMRARAIEELALVGLGEFARHMPSQLNDAQRQRVALARTLVVADRLCLLDEPFAAQSPQLQVQLSRLVRRRQELVGMTMLMATEDPATALRIADQVAVMHDGCLLQVDSPDALYDRPATAEVARLTGTANLVHGEVKLSAGQAIFYSDKGLAVPLFDDAVRRPREAMAFFRPGALHLIDDDGLPSSDDIRLSGRVLECEFLGDTRRYRLELSGHVVWMDVPRSHRDTSLVNGDTVSVGLDPAQIRVLEK